MHCFSLNAQIILHGWLFDFSVLSVDMDRMPLLQTFDALRRVASLGRCYFRIQKVVIP